MLGCAFPPDIITSVRTFYLASAAVIVAVRLIPALRDRFLDYGPRNSCPARGPSPEHDSTASPSTMTLKMLDYATTLQLSHSYFVSFYILSATLCIFWILDLLCDGPFRPMLSSPATLSAWATSPPLWKPTLSLSLLLVHSLRRVYESLYVSVSNPKSTMWVGHCAIGLAFFSVVSTAIVAEYSAAPSLTGQYSMSTFDITVVLLTTVTFIVASLWQYLYHAYLASLRKYTLPQAYGASYIVAPHYTADCLIYLCLTILSAHGGFINWTMMTVLIFVVVNLGVTADGTQKWMLSKFRDQHSLVRCRWKMLPGLW